LLAKIDINSEIAKQKLKKRDMNEAQTRFNKIDPKLRDAGWGYDSPVPCGEPTYCPGDITETVLLPKALLSMHPEFMIPVKGDSMRDAGIVAGDLVKVVATALGYSNPRKALLDHVDNEDKGVTKRDTLGGTQRMTVINESGLYSLVLSSKLPQAKAFKRWVTSEVLPQIRQMIRMWIHRKYVLQITDNSFKKVKSDK
jgi:hypothetical protein